jgi:hypothetical protein
MSLLSKLADSPSGPRGTALSHHEFDIETKNTFPLAPLGERGDRKAGGEGVFAKMEFVWETRKSQAKGKNEMPSESTGSQKAHEFLTPSPVLPRLMKTPVAVHPLPQGGEGYVFPWSPLETRWLDRQCENAPQLPRLASACAAPHSQPDDICFGHECGHVAHGWIAMGYMTTPLRGSMRSVVQHLSSKPVSRAFGYREPLF